METNTKERVKTFKFRDSGDKYYILLLHHMLDFSIVLISKYF